MSGSALVRAFLQGGAADDREALDADLRTALACARAAWPGLTVDDEAFAAWLGERCPDASTLRELDAAALLLTHAVAQRVDGAVEAFVQTHGPDIDLALRRTSLRPDALDDARQVVLDKLLSPDRDKLRDYGGRGSLAHWVRAVAVRQAISLARKRGPMERVVAEPSTGDPDVGADPDLAFLKAHYRERFKRAFAAVLAELPAADRTLLRLRFVDGLTLDQLAKVRGVHRATGARHLARVRAVLIDAVRARLGAEAGLGSDSELDSALRLVESNLELSLPRLLGEPAP